MTRIAMSTNMGNPEFSLPLADLLDKGILEAFTSTKKAKTSAATWLAQGELDKEEYVRLLMMIWHVYDTLERALALHSSHPSLQPTYNPSVLARADSIANDISYLLQVPESSWKSHPIHTTLLSSAPAPLTAYTSRLQALSDSADPSLLLAHAYVRYLGDMRGGLIIRHRLAEVYGLDEVHGLGVKFYDFKEFGASQQWYRDGLDLGVGDNLELKAALVRECIKAFKLNSALFTVLQAPKSQPTTTEPTLPHLGNPISEDEDPKKDISIAIEHGKPEPGGGMVSLASVIAVIAAVCLAHFVIVVGGLTGARGYAKLQAFEQWLYTVWESLTS